MMGFIFVKRAPDTSGRVSVRLQYEEEAPSCTYSFVSLEVLILVAVAKKLHNATLGLDLSVVQRNDGESLDFAVVGLLWKDAAQHEVSKARRNNVHLLGDEGQKERVSFESITRLDNDITENFDCCGLSNTFVEVGSPNGLLEEVCGGVSEWMSTQMYQRKASSPSKPPLSRRSDLTSSMRERVGGRGGRDVMLRVTGKEMDTRVRFIVQY